MATQPKKSRQWLHRLLVLDRPSGAADVEPMAVFCRSLPDAFVGARIAVVADVHLPDTLIPLRRLAQTVAWQRPDAIFLVGDLTNSYTDFDKDGLRELARAMTAIAPCFAIAGNHEWRLEREPLYAEILREAGVHYLCDSAADWEKDGQSVRVYGMGRRRPLPFAPAEKTTLVLAHKPDYFSYYREAKWETVVCGHAHGGQVRIADRSLYAPGQGFFPTYTNGIYRDGSTTMVVSRGLGNSSVPWRIGNRPHLPLLLLMPQPDTDKTDATRQ